MNTDLELIKYLIKNSKLTLIQCNSKIDNIEILSGLNIKRHSNVKSALRDIKLGRLLKTTDDDIMLFECHTFEPHHIKDPIDKKIYYSGFIRDIRVISSKCRVIITTPFYMDMTNQKFQMRLPETFLYNASLVLNIDNNKFIKIEKNHIPYEKINEQ